MVSLMAVDKCIIEVNVSYVHIPKETNCRWTVVASRFGCDPVYNRHFQLV